MTRWDHAGVVIEKMARRGWGVQVTSETQSAFKITLFYRGKQLEKRSYGPGVRSEHLIPAAITEAAVAAIELKP